MRTLLAIVVTAILLVLALWGSSGAATKSCPSGSLGPLTTVGPNPTLVTAKNATAIVFQATATAGTATVEVDISCDGTNWAQVANSVMTLTAGASQAVSFLYPTCQYRVNATACATCTVAVAYGCSGP